MAVFITGASSGIGEACARAFARAQYDIILTARREDRLLKLQAELKEAYPVQVHVFPLDVRNPTQLKNLAESHPEIFNSVEIVINNAGLAKGLTPIQEGNPMEWDLMIDTNIKGLLYVTRLFLPQLIKNQKGHIINIGSIAGHWTYERGNVYSATKFAVRALTEAFRHDLKGTGVRVTEISPGNVETEFSLVRFEDTERAKAVYANNTPLQAEDIAESILWCAQRPAHVNIQELIIYPTEQAGVGAHSFKK